MANTFETLSVLCREGRNSRDFGMIVTKAYEIAVIMKKTAVNAGPMSPEATKVYRRLRFLGRLKSAYSTLLECTALLSSFTTIKIQDISEIVLQGRRHAAQPDPQHMNERTTRRGHTTSVSRGKAKARVKTGFRLHIHAEMQMLFSVMARIDHGSNVFRYLGISKKSCFLCGYILRKVDLFGTRGCHGRLYYGWTLPRILEMDHNHFSSLATAVTSLEDYLVNLNRLENKSHAQFVAESTFVESERLNQSYGNVTSQQQRTRHRHEMNVDALRVLTARSVKHQFPNLEKIDLCAGNQGPACSYDLKEKSVPAVETTVSQKNCSVTEVEPYFQRCSTCCKTGAESVKLKRCAKCHTAYYCSRSCQKSAWPEHKFLCSLGRPLDSADYLVVDCLQGETPQEPTVIDDFGFAHCHTAHDGARLLGLYQGLVKHLKVSSRKLHQWQLAGTLRKSIHEAFAELPAFQRGGYYRWFQEHEDLLDFRRRLSTEEEFRNAWAPKVHLLAEQD